MKCVWYSLDTLAQVLDTPSTFRYDLFSYRMGIYFVNDNIGTALRAYDGCLDYNTCMIKLLHHTIKDI